MQGGGGMPSQTLEIWSSLRIRMRDIICGFTIFFLTGRHLKYTNGFDCSFGSLALKFFLEKENLSDYDWQIEPPSEFCYIQVQNM